MTISAVKTVGELAVELPGSTRIFEKLGIDYCCGGGKSLEDACLRAGISVEAVLHSLEDADSESREAAEYKDWRKEPLSKLIDYILVKHHIFDKDELNRIEPLLAKVVSVHGENHPELRRIQELFSTLKQDLLLHMLKEEQVLFPYVIQLEEAIKENTQLPKPPFVTVKNPIKMMMKEHDSAGDILKSIRESSSNYDAPEDGCISYKTLYQALEVLEADIHAHIHLENNILFPRASEIE